MYLSNQILRRRSLQPSRHDPGRLKEFGFANVSALTLGMVGQPLALAWVVKGMAAKLAFPEEGKPLVMVFGGYPGHGKTELSTLLAEMMAITGAKAVVTRRVDLFIPFFTFTAPKCYVLAEVDQPDDRRSAPPTHQHHGRGGGR